MTLTYSIIWASFGGALGGRMLVHLFTRTVPDIGWVNGAFVMAAALSALLWLRG